MRKSKKEKNSFALQQGKTYTDWRKVFTTIGVEDETDFKHYLALISAWSTCPVGCLNAYIPRHSHNSCPCDNGLERYGRSITSAFENKDIERCLLLLDVLESIEAVLLYGIKKEAEMELERVTKKYKTIISSI